MMDRSRRQKGTLLHCNSKTLLHRHKPVPQLRKIFIKNITPKFHSGRQLSLLVVVSKASITIGRDSMKMLAEYLEKAITFETLAAEENDAKVKANLIAQAKAYRKLATERATRYGLKHPSWAKSESAGGQT
jgi:hypothetical protein